MTAFVEGGQDPQLDTLLDSYRYAAPSHVKFRLVDPDVHDYRIDAAETARLREELAGRELPVGYGPGEVHPDGKRTGEFLAKGGR